MFHQTSFHQRQGTESFQPYPALWRRSNREDYDAAAGVSFRIQDISKGKHNQAAELRDHREPRDPSHWLGNSRFQAGFRIIAVLFQPYSEPLLRSDDAYPGQSSCESGHGQQASVQVGKRAC